MPRPTRPQLAGILTSTARALSFAAREGAQGHWGWCAVGLTSALQGACLAALMGYETAAPEDILAPGGTARADKPATVTLAPLSLLLRRVRSDRYLNPPEQVRLSRPELAALGELIALRNAMLHHWPPTEAAGLETASDGFGVAIALLRHLLCDHPAFDAAPHSRVLGAAADALDRLAQQAAISPPTRNR